MKDLHLTMLHEVLAENLHQILTTADITVLHEVLAENLHQILTPGRYEGLTLDSAS